jgi:transposase
LPQQPREPTGRDIAAHGHLDERIETVTGEIEELSRVVVKCHRLMSVPGIGPVISTGLAAAIVTGEAFERGR